MSTGFYFGIPLLSKTVCADWDLVCKLLSRTVESCFSGDDKTARVLIACHEKPDLQLHDSALHERVEFLHCPEPPPSPSATKAERRSDKHRKMGMAVSRATDGADCHIFILDADDVVSTGIVPHIRSKGPRSVILQVGYVFNERSSDFYLRDRFDQYCGSACALFIGKEPETSEGLDGRALSQVPMSHKHWDNLIKRFGGRYVKSSEPHVVYIKNHGGNLSFLGDSGRPDPNRSKRFEARFSEEDSAVESAEPDVREFERLFPILARDAPVSA